MVARELLLVVVLDSPEPALKPLLALEPRLVTDSAREQVLTSRGRNGSRDVVVVDEDDPAVEPAVDDDFLIIALIGAIYLRGLLRWWWYLERACNAMQQTLKPQRRKKANDAIIESNCSCLCLHKKSSGRNPNRRSKSRIR